MRVLGPATDQAGERHRVLAVLALATLVAWILMAFGGGGAGRGMMSSVSISPLERALAWAVMVIAMMLPTVYYPLIHVHERSLRRVRSRAMSLFLVGYIAVWMAAGAILVAATLALRTASSDAPWLVILSAMALVIWQSSPWRQVALNGCHRRPPLAAFAPAAYRDAFSRGVQHGLWCIAACWALMLTALFARGYQMPVMVAATVFIWAEKLEPPRAPEWRLGLPSRAVRLMVWFVRRRGGNRYLPARTR